MLLAFSHLGGEAVTFTVFFIDYGNIETSPLSGLLDIGSELSTIPPQACLCSLDSVRITISSHENRTLNLS